MAGIQIQFTVPTAAKDADLSEKSTFPTETSELLYRDEYCTIRVFVHDTYPYRYIATEHGGIVFEGTVNNRLLPETIERLTSIDAVLATEGSADDLIESFVEDSDGDFIVVIYNVHRKLLVCFNDRYSRLPVFHYHDSTMFLAARRISYLLPAVPALTIDRRSIAEYLAFEFYFGDKTVFQQVKRLQPASMIRASVAGDRGTERISASIKNVMPTIFDEVHREQSRAACIDQYTRLFLASLDSRYRKSHERGYEVTVDLSGGYDSRSILMGLEHLGHKASYYTHRIITGDESVVAGALGNAYGHAVTPICADHDLDESLSEELTYATDLTVNGWTTVSCWQDYMKRKQGSPAGSVLFTGLGGGYARHPYKPVLSIHSLSDMARFHVLPSEIPLGTACSLVNIPTDTFLNHISAHFETYPEHTVQGRFKRFYYEYHKLVYAGEDRTRSISWTFTPFDSIQLMNYTFQSIPLEYIGYDFFLSFMRKLGTAGLRVPIHGSAVPLTMPMSGRILDMQSWMKSSVRARLKRNGILRQVYRMITKPDTATEEYEKTSSSLMTYLDRSDASERLFNRDNVRNQIAAGMRIVDLHRILSVMMYLRQIEQRYGDKLEIT